MAIIEQQIEQNYAVWNGDCMEVMPSIPSGSVHLSIYSPPFCGLYQYSSSERDLSNCRDYAEFFRHYEFVVREIYRMTLPGRMTVVHCMDVPASNTGKMDHYLDFPGDIIRLHEKCGFKMASPRICVWKEPLTVRNRTMTKSLAHKSIVMDSANCTVAGGDYLLIFRRDGANKVPITHQHGLMSYAGQRKVPHELMRYRGWKGNQIQNRYSHWIWRQYASCFWDDIRLDRVLPFRPAREEEDEKHVHPLQLDVIERACVLWSNPKETVFTPFMGVGSEVCGAIANGRRGLGVELKPSYYHQAKKNIDYAVREGIEKIEMDSLFADLEDSMDGEEMEEIDA